jgi:hypothetical protein
MHFESGDSTDTSSIISTLAQIVQLRINLRQSKSSRVPIENMTSSPGLVSCVTKNTVEHGVELLWIVLKHSS